RRIRRSQTVSAPPRFESPRGLAHGRGTGPSTAGQKPARGGTLSDRTVRRRCRRPRKAQATRVTCHPRSVFSSSQDGDVAQGITNVSDLRALTAICSKVLPAEQPTAYEPDLEI